MNELNNKLEKYYNFKINAIEKNVDSTDGNVYIINCKNKKYVAKIYNNIEHVKSMVDIHKYLINNNLLVPKIISTIEKDYFIRVNDKYVIVYSFLPGKQISRIIKNNVIEDKNIIAIAKEIKKLHNVTQNKKFGLQELSFANKLQRKSVIHFDLTKDNIFINNEIVGFIDFDDAKYGDSICDIAIAISLLFISKKRGIDFNGIKLFIKNYYNEDTNLMKKETPLINEYAINWMDYILSDNNFETSIKESFEFKRKMVKLIGGKMLWEKK